MHQFAAAPKLVIKTLLFTVCPGLTDMDELPVSSNWTLAVWIDASLIRRKLPPLTSMPSMAILKSENSSNVCESSDESLILSK